MSLYNKASLIQVPSLYKDGTLVSTVPEDRSGDFAVARGSNLSATRIGEDGYIKKGYENLLLQSNSFDTTWVTSGTLTSGQSGYDGSNDAWLFESPSTFMQMGQSVSVSGVQTYSVYAKAGTTDWVQIRLLGSSTIYATFDLNPSTTGNRIGATASEIDASIEDVGNGWFRCVLVANNTTSTARIYIARNNSTTINVGDSIYIQDAQLNQGLVAYPYLETTTAPAQGGLLENTPRLDWSNGVPAVLVEESRTNVTLDSEYFDGSNYIKGGNAQIENNSIVSPEGLQNASKFYGSTTSLTFSRIELSSVITGRTISVFAKAGELSEFLFLGENPNEGPYFNLNDGSISGYYLDRTDGIENAYSIDYGNGWYRFVVTFSTNREVRFFLSENQDITFNQTAGNGIHLYGLQIEQDATSPSSYIPTYGTTQTRSSETVSDTFTIPTTATIYNSFYAPASEQVYILDQVFSVSEGLNNVAIAFSPTAVKISVGGAIVASSTGSYDTTSLTSISLGSDSGADYSNAPISGFYVFPEFLTDDELNSLTA